MKKLFILMSLLITGCQSSDLEVTEAILGFSSDDFLLSDHPILIHEELKSFPNESEVAIAIILGNEPHYYGVKRVNDTLKATSNSEAVFEIGSISKIFTSTLLAGYVDEGKLELNDNINDYLDFQLNDSIKITFKELSNHTSGLPRMPSNFLLSALLRPGNPYKKYNEEKLESYLSEKLILTYEQGERNSYSNLGMGLLGYTLSKFSGTDYQTMLKEKIFDKYEMTQSTTIRSEIEPVLVPGLDKNGKNTSNWDLSALIAAGGILSSTADLTKFALAQFDTANHELNLTREITYSDTSGLEMGLGWHIINTESDNTWYWHNGGTGGYRSSMAIEIDKKNAVIVLSNVSASHVNSRNIDNLCFALIKSLSEN